MDLVSLHLLDSAGSEEMPRAWPAQIALAVLLIVAVIVALAPLAPPPSLASIAPDRDFATGRAMRHFDAVANAASPDEVAAWTGTRLGALGFHVTALPGPPGGDVLARLPGMDSSGAILVAARCAPGGEASGALVVHEAMRALTAGGRPKNDLVVLLTTGAAPLPPLDADPATRDVAVVLALAGSGAASPSAVVAAAPGSGTVLAKAAAAAPHPVVLLALNDLRARGGAVAPWALGLLAGGRPGLVLGAWSGRPAARPDLSAMQDDGATLLALLRQFGEEPLGAPDGGDRIALHAGSRLFLYPAAWARSLALVSALVAGVILVLGLVRKRLSAGGLLLGLGAFLGAVAVAGLLGLAAGAIARAVRPAGDALGLAAALTALFAAAVALAADAVIRRGGAADAPLASAGLLVWALASLVTGFSFPALSGAVIWPLLLLVPAFLTVFLLHEPARHPWLRAAALAVAAVPAILVLTPPYVFLSGLVTTAAGVSVFVPGALAGFLFAALFALLPHAPRRRTP
jgi:hypothetical protein